MLLRAAVAALLTASVALDASDRRTHVVSLPPDRTLSVEVTIGEIRVHGETRGDVSIEIVRTAPTKDDLSRIPVEVEESPAAVVVRAPQVGGGTDPALKTNVTLRVPHEAHLASLRVMEGRITIAGLRGSINADVRRGPIEATDVEGVVRLETGIGDVTANQMRLTPKGLLRLRTFNGDIHVSLAERPIHARVMALALNGTIASEIPLRMRDTWGPRWGEATLGDGEPVISLDVITGEIVIKTP